MMLFRKIDRFGARAFRSVTQGRRLALVVAGAALFAVGSPADARKSGSEPVAPLVDHHIHIQSAAVSDLMRKAMKKTPESFQGMSEDLFKVRTGEDAVHELDRAGIKQGVLLSTGYMFASPILPIDPAESARRMHEENQYNVDAALASHGRLIAFVGINPFAANAAEELAYWSRQPGAAGVKLHFGNSRFNFASTEQMEKLAAFFRAARAAKMPLIVHSRTDDGFTPQNIHRFIDTVLSQAGDLPIQLAHGGGYGGVDAATLESLAAYGDAIARKAPGTRNLVFDLSAVVQYQLVENAEERAKYTRRYVALMRKIGFNRFVLGSDWPGLHPPAEYFAIERVQLPVNAREWQQLCRNRAPYLLPAWARKKNAD
ncbi:MAG: amidohydrolase family protein [Pseudomonadota bacterium]